MSSSRTRSFSVPGKDVWQRIKARPLCHGLDTCTELVEKRSAVCLEGNIGHEIFGSVKIALINEVIMKLGKGRMLQSCGRSRWYRTLQSLKRFLHASLPQVLEYEPCTCAFAELPEHRSVALGPHLQRALPG